MTKKTGLIIPILAAIIGPLITYYLNNLPKVEKADKSPCVSFSGNNGNTISRSKFSIEINCGVVTSTTEITMN
jgi:hypothetical protein